MDDGKFNNKDVIYIGFSKAFDIVFHILLLYKLGVHVYGVGGKVLARIQTYLTNLHQRVAING